MDTRKIQTVGGGTYTVSLPKGWAETQDLEAGDTVTLHTHIDGLLVIQAAGGDDTAPERLVVSVDHDEPDPLDRMLRAAYAAGAKEATFEATEAFTADQRRTLEAAARDLTGVSVAERSEAEITVRTLLDSEEVSVRQSIRQLEFVALEMHRDAVDALRGEGDPEGLADRDDQADRLHALIGRSFARGLARLDEVDALGVTRPELFELWATTRELERVADHAEALADLAAETRRAVDDDRAEDVAALADTARGAVAEAVSAVIGDDGVEAARAALAARDQVCEEVATVESTFPADSRLRPALRRISRTAEHGGNIAEFGLQRAVRQGELTGPTQQSGTRDEGADLTAGE
ncbi:MAG: PhoU domain-containing protein [Halobacteriales archaeon]